MKFLPIWLTAISSLQLSQIVASSIFEYKPGISTQHFADVRTTGATFIEKKNEHFSKRESKDQFYDLVLNWKINNPKLARNLSDSLIEETWNQLSGTSTRQSSPNLKLNVSSASGQSVRRSAATDLDIETARALVTQSIQRASDHNRKTALIKRNKYILKSAESTASRVDHVPFVLDQASRDAAALVAEVDAGAKANNGTLYRQYSIPHSGPDGELVWTTHNPIHLRKRDSDYWLAELGATKPGNFPFGEDSSYTVFRNVLDYGAKGDGITDDTDAINRAISDGDRCGSNCGGSTVKGALVYFPGGTYLVSSSIVALYNTQLVGNPNDLPVILAAPSFTDLGVITSNIYIENGNGGTWYLNTANFLRQVRNFIIDMQDVKVEEAKGIHWQVAQATSLHNIIVQMRTGSTQIGVFAENGSGGILDNLSFIGGAMGIQCGNQQFTSQSLAFIGCTTAISMLWDWGWTWKDLIIYDSKYGIKFETSDFSGGSLVIMDSRLIGVETGIQIDQPTDSATITLRNIEYSSTEVVVRNADSGALLAGGSGTIDYWFIGNVYEAPNYELRHLNGETSPAAIEKQTEILRDDIGFGYYARIKPQYQDEAANLVLILDAAGDGVNDDSASLSFYIEVSVAYKRLLFIPTGSYVITETIYVPSGAKIVGACWSQLVASGPAFEDINSPKVMFQIGKENEIGSVELSDLLFTAKGPTAGLVLLEWNLAAAEKGGAGMWDCHFRLGGAKGTGLQVADCPKLPASVNPKCIIGSLMIHLTPTSSAYFENVWVWAADHDLDDPASRSEAQIDVYVARGILIESRGPTWFYGTASEHCVLYQYALSGASNIFMGMIQTESPYYLPSPPAPEPFQNTIENFPSDPDFSDCNNDGCRVSWALYVEQSSNVIVAGAGLYSWFYNAYDRSCVATQTCQQRLLSVDEGSDIIIYNLYTVGIEEMATLAGVDPILAKDNIMVSQDPYVSIIAALGKRPATGIGLGGVFVETPSDLQQANCNDPDGLGYLYLMDWFFDEHYEENGHIREWDTQLFKLFSGDLNACSTLAISQCVEPMACNEDTEKILNGPNMYWCEFVIHQYWTMVTGINTMVISAVLNASIATIDRIHEDFPLEDNSSNNKGTELLTILSAAFGWGGFLAGLVTGRKSELAEEVLGVFGQLFSTVKDFIPEDEDPDARQAMKVALQGFNTAMEQSHVTTLIDMFQKADLSKWPREYFPADRPFKHDIPNFFADGRYTRQILGSEESALREHITQFINEGMIAIALMEDNYYVIADAYYPEGCEDATPTARLIDGKCYALHKPGEGWTGYDITDPEWYSKPMEQETTEKLVDVWKVNLERVYRTSINCQLDSNEYYFNSTAYGPRPVPNNEDDFLSTCFFTFPVLFAKLPGSVTDPTPCYIKGLDAGDKAGYNYLPPKLDEIFDGSFCNTLCVGDGCENNGCQDPKTCAEIPDR